MNAISLNNSDDLELGQIPSSTPPEPKPAKPNTPLARLFFDPTKPLSPPPRHDHEGESERHHTESSHSQPDSEEGKGVGRSRSRDRRRTHLADDEEEGGRRRNRRLAKKRKQAEGTAGKQGSGSSPSEDSSSPLPAEPLNSLSHSQTLAIIQKPPIKQCKDVFLEVKQCQEGLHAEKAQEKSSSVKLNNTNFDRFFKTRICPQFQAGFCERNLRCTFAHGEKQLREVQSSRCGATYKTKTCNNFDKGLCHKKKQDCNYAHGKEDLRVGRHEDSQSRPKKTQNQSLPRTITNGEKNDHRNEERQSTSASRQGKNDQEQTRRPHNSKNNSKAEKDINEKYTLTDKQHSFFHKEKLPSQQSMRNYDYHQQGSYSVTPSDPMAAGGFHNKNMSGNNFYGGYFPPGMPFVPSQSQLHGFPTPPPLPEGYQNYYVPIYSCYSPLQHQMNFIPSFANFPPQPGNSAAFNSPRTSYDFLNACNPATASPEGGLHAARGDKKQSSRHRPGRWEQQPNHHH